MKTFTTTALDKSNPTPLYYQLQTIIQDDINADRLQPGDLIPTEIQLSEEYKVSRTTVRQAIMSLVMEGKLFRVKGKGTFVAEPKITQDFMQRLEPFSEQMKRLGLKAYTKVLDMSCVPPPAEVSEVLNSKENVIRLTRLRGANDEPIVVLTTYLPLRCSEILKEDMSKTGLYEFLAREDNLRINRVIRKVEAVAAGKYEGELLDIKIGSPIQLTTSIGYTKNSEVMEYSIARYRGDKNLFIVELRT